MPRLTPLERSDVPDLEDIFQRAEQGIGPALAREFRCTWRSISEGDFLEGIRAAVIDKDRSPRWSHELTGVPEQTLAAMRAPLDADELALNG